MVRLSLLTSLAVIPTAPAHEWPKPTSYSHPRCDIMYTGNVFSAVRHFMHPRFAEHEAMEYLAAFPDQQLRERIGFTDFGIWTIVHLQRCFRHRRFFRWLQFRQRCAVVAKLRLTLDPWLIEGTNKQVLGFLARPVRWNPALALTIDDLSRFQLKWMALPPHITLRLPEAIAHRDLNNRFSSVCFMGTPHVDRLGRYGIGPKGRGREHPQRITPEGCLCVLLPLHYFQEPFPSFPSRFLLPQIHFALDPANYRS